MQGVDEANFEVQGLSKRQGSAMRLRSEQRSLPCTVSVSALGFCTNDYLRMLSREPNKKGGGVIQ